MREGRRWTRWRRGRAVHNNLACEIDKFFLRRDCRCCRQSDIIGQSMTDELGGHVYVLVSPKSEFVKIGGTDFPPLKRIREINATSPYREHGPWSLSDFRQVSDWRKVESSLHYAFRSSLVAEIVGAKELFRIAPALVAAKLNEIDSALIVKKPKIDRMFQDSDFANFIMRIFAFTGLLNWLDIQGAWIFVLFPSTSGGRYFTINIDRHEVAFSTLPSAYNGKPWHMLVVDRLIYDFPIVLRWIKDHDGKFDDDRYASGMPRSVSLRFSASFEETSKFLQLDGVRRALIAYWAEALIGLKERGSSSMFARHHNWNAIAEIRSRMISQGQ